jgi:hypothetical protein
MAEKVTTKHENRHLLTNLLLSRRSADWLVLPEAASRKARQDGEQGPKGCGQDVRNRRPGQGWPVCRPLQPDEKAEAPQLEVRPGGLGKMIDMKRQ